jgi:MFS family permease
MHRKNLAQGAVTTIQGAGAAVSPALGGWIAERIGFAPTFLVLGALGLAAVGSWVVLGGAMKQS